MNMPATELAIIPFPSRSLDACGTVADVKDFKAEVAAMRAWAKSQDNPTVEAAAAELDMRADRKIGQLMAAQKAAGLMAKPPGDNQYQKQDRDQFRPEAPITLAEAGIDKHLAQRARDAAGKSGRSACAESGPLMTL